MGRSSAQTMASDVARLEPLIAELAKVRRRRDELTETRRDARKELGLLKPRQPAWYRPRARSEHAVATDRATKIVERIDRALLGLDSRENALLGQLARERAARQPEQVRERVVRARQRGHDMGLGL
jgi:hypothetical protein